MASTTRSRSSGWMRSLYASNVRPKAPGGNPWIRSRFSDQRISPVPTSHSQLPISPASSANRKLASLRRNASSDCGGSAPLEMTTLTEQKYTRTPSMRTFHFADQLLERVRDLGHPCVVGLDPDLSRMPRSFLAGRARDPASAAQALGDYCQ